MSKLPDRTGILITPFSGFLAGSIFGALLVSSAMETHEPRRKVSEQMLYALAKSIGLVPSIVVAALLTVSTAIWLIVRYRYYRARVAEDRQKAGQV
jgi:biotin transporter BioY